MRKLIYFPLFIIIACLFASCEKPIMDDDDDEVVEQRPKGNFKVSVFKLEQTPFNSFTRAVASEACTRLNFAIYNMAGTRLKQTNQTISDADFGSAYFQLAEGDYQLVAVAHSSNGNPTMTNPSKIQFSNTLGFTDTFLCSGEFSIQDEPVELMLSLDRIVALCRFVITDDYPEEVTKMRFQYKGGSGAFDANTGLGCVNSTQTVNCSVTNGQKQFDLYTFLHDTEGTIHLTVTAYDSKDNIVHEREFDVPLIQNHVTWFSGAYFSGSGSGSSSMTIDINTDWAGEEHLSF